MQFTISYLLPIAVLVDASVVKMKPVVVTRLGGPHRCFAFGGVALASLPVFLESSSAFHQGDLTLVLTPKCDCLLKKKFQVLFAPLDFFKEWNCTAYRASTGDRSQRPAPMWPPAERRGEAASHPACLCLEKTKFIYLQQNKTKLISFFGSLRFLLSTL